MTASKQCRLKVTAARSARPAARSSPRWRQGLTLDEVKELGLAEINDEMGEEVVKSRVRCATLALGTLQAAVDQFRRDRERREAGLPPIEMKPFEV